MLQKHGKALVIYGAGHFWRTFPKDALSSMGKDIGLARMLEVEYPSRTFVAIPVGGRVAPRPGVTLNVYPDYQKFDRALTTWVRPVLVNLQRSPFPDFTAEEFLGYQVVHCRGGRDCVSIFQGTSVTLSQIADACLYVGEGADADTKAKPIR